MSTMNWKEPETKSKLLLAILATQEEGALSGAKASKIAEYMGCTPKAVTHQLTALRKEIAEFKGSDGAASPVTASAKKRKSKNGDSDGSASPTKKAKATPKKKGTKKPEEVVEDTSDADDDVAARKDKAEGKEGEANGVEKEESE